MRALGERKEKRLAELTGLDEAVVVRCKKLLSFNKHYQDMMLDADPNTRMKADFFIELYAVRNDREVNKFPWFKKDEFTDAIKTARGIREGCRANSRPLEHQFSDHRSRGKEGCKSGRESILPSWVDRRRGILR